MLDDSDNLERNLQEFTDVAIAFPPGTKGKRPRRPVPWPATWWWVVSGGVAVLTLLFGFWIGFLVGR
jgi:hypothetical protein